MKRLSPAASATSAVFPQTAKRVPAAPPTTARRTDSVSSWRTSRPRPGAEGEPRRDLRPPQGRPREQEVREVRARDQEHGRDDEEQAPDRPGVHPAMLAEPASARIGEQSRIVLPLEARDVAVAPRRRHDLERLRLERRDSGSGPPAPAWRRASGGP
jgi:hypothetical protein